MNSPDPFLTKTAYDHDLLMVYANNDQSVCQCLPPLVTNLNDLPMVISRLDGALTSAKRLRPIVQGKQFISNLVKKG